MKSVAERVGFENISGDPNHTPEEAEQISDDAKRITDTAIASYNQGEGEASTERMNQCLREAVDGYNNENGPFQADIKFLSEKFGGVNIHLNIDRRTVN